MVVCTAKATNVIALTPSLEFSSLSRFRRTDVSWWQTPEGRAHFLHHSPDPAFRAITHRKVACANYACFGITCWVYYCYVNPSPNISHPSAETATEKAQ